MPPRLFVCNGLPFNTGTRLAADSLTLAPLGACAVRKPDSSDDDTASQTSQSDKELRREARLRAERLRWEQANLERKVQKLLPAAMLDVLRSRLGAITR